MLSHLKDPHGENIFKSSGASGDLNNPNPRRMSKRISSAQASIEKNGSGFSAGVVEGKAVAGLKRRIMELESKLSLFSIEVNIIRWQFRGWGGKVL